MSIEATPPAADGARHGTGFARCIVMAPWCALVCCMVCARWGSGARGLSHAVRCCKLHGVCMLRICTIQAGTMLVVHCIWDVARWVMLGRGFRGGTVHVAGCIMLVTLCMTHAVSCQLYVVPSMLQQPSMQNCARCKLSRAAHFIANATRCIVLGVRCTLYVSTSGILAFRCAGCITLVSEPKRGIVVPYRRIMLEGTRLLMLRYETL
jgi:hypothetical protein